MPDYAAEYIRHLERNNDKHEVVRPGVILHRYRGDNCDSIRIFVIFDKDGDNIVAFDGYGLGHVDGNKLAAALVLCNEMNNTWRWVKFYIDRDGDIRVQDDAVIDLSSVGDECDELVSRMVDIIDKAYPDFMRLKWS